MRKLTTLLLLAALTGCARESNAPQTATVPSNPPPTAPAVQAGGTGSAMPPYTAKGLDGKPFDLASLHGQVVFLNLWATWCGPCRFEIPELQAMHDKYATRGFKVVGVSLDETGADAVKQFVSDHKMTYPIVIDPDGRIAGLLSTSVLPTSVIIDRNGKIIWRQLGAIMPNDMASVDAVVEKALGS